MARWNSGVSFGVADHASEELLSGAANFGVYSFPPLRINGLGKKGHLLEELAVHVLAEEEIVAVFPGDSPSRP